MILSLRPYLFVSFFTQSTEKVTILPLGPIFMSDFFTCHGMPIKISHCLKMFILYLIDRYVYIK